MPVIIDGYNLLRLVQKIEQFEYLDEVGLCRILSDYLRYIQDHGHVVFDGTGPRDKSDFDLLGDLAAIEVYFSGADYSADDVIEEKIADSTAPSSLVIVSSDRVLRRAAAEKKAVSVKSDIFWNGLVTLLETRRKPVYEPKAKQKGITDPEADQWLGFFGIKND
jgi:predicted RNA-binding protein with PIN domain